MTIRPPINTIMSAACVLALITSCSSPDATSAVARTSTSDRVPHASSVLPTGLNAGPATQSARGNGSLVYPYPATTGASIPDPVTGTATAITAARAWAIAANSTSYLDPDPGSWTSRTKPFVTGAEATAEQQQAAGAGGTTWAFIEVDRCITTLRQLSAGIPSRDAPTGPDLHIVDVTATITLTCATGQVQLTQFAAQLAVVHIVVAQHDRWLIADVEH